MRITLGVLRLMFLFQGGPFKKVFLEVFFLNGGPIEFSIGGTIDSGSSDIKDLEQAKRFLMCFR